MKIKKTLSCTFYIIMVFWFGCSPSSGWKEATLVSRPARIQPDYSEITIPPNIAPLNFRVEETGVRFRVEIRGPAEPSIQIQGKSPVIQIPLEDWERFLLANRGNDYNVEIYLEDSTGNWIRFSPIKNRIAGDSIDSFLAYRRLGPLYSFWKKMGIFQRNLENFDESPVYLSRLTGNSCMNCHNFSNNSTDRWLLHLRGGPGTGMLLVDGDKVNKISTKTDFNGHVAYPAWHPSGNLAVFSSNRLILFFHSTGEPRDVLDLASNLVVYNISTNVLTTASQIADPERMENWPAWSPDGKYLYFCSAPKLETYENIEEQELAYREIKYDLMRLSFDEKNQRWGKLELVLSGAGIEGSINQPRVSPDGRFVLFTVSEYGNFPIYLSSADLYLLDLSTGKSKRLEINSDYVESFHAWSSNGRWIVFSSKRIDHLFARPYFAYMDVNGEFSKPFVLPQKDPGYYETRLETFNVPEFIREPVDISAKRLAKTAYQEAKSVELDPKWIPAEKKEEKPMYSPQPQ